MTEPDITPELVAKRNRTHGRSFRPGSDDGKWIFESIFAALKNKTVAQAA